MKQLMNLCLIVEDNQILLAMKKRGFGEGRWNGYGGKVEDGESIEECAAREVQEEVGIKVINLDKRGILEFDFVGKDKTLEVHIFEITDYDGKPVETEEMKPGWFSFDEIPYDQMWSDDKYWLPLFLAGKTFRGRFLFDQPANKDTQAQIIEHELEVVSQLD